MKHKSIYNYKYLLKKRCLSKQIFFILFLKDEINTDFIISLFNEFHILTDIINSIFNCIIIIMYYI